VAESDALRHELAEYDVEEAEDQVREQDRDDRRHPRIECVRERGLAQGADAQRGERDAELHRGDEAAGVAGDPQHVARAAVPLMVQLDDPRPARGHEPVLGRDEERVEENQDPDADELEEECHAPTSGAQVLGGMSSTSYAPV
jgi:hypothetical protein